MHRLRSLSFVLGVVCAGIIALGMALGVGLFSAEQTCVATGENISEPAVLVSAEQTPHWNLTVTNQPLTQPAATHVEMPEVCKTSLVTALSSFTKLEIGIHIAAIAIALVGLGWIIQILIVLRRRN